MKSRFVSAAGRSYFLILVVVVMPTTWNDMKATLQYNDASVGLPTLKTICKENDNAFYGTSEHTTVW